MRALTNNITPSGSVRRETRGGRDYLVFPTVIAREMVMNYPEYDRDEYLPADHLAESAEAWNGAPITVNHPTKGGHGHTANTPEAYTERSIGSLFNPEMVGNNDRLRAEAWVDVEKANSLGGEHADIISRLESGEEIGVSIGYGTIDDDPTPGEFDGDRYDLTQGVPVPDHLALVGSDEQPRATPEDGVGAPRLNHVAMTDTENESDDQPENETDETDTEPDQSTDTSESDPDTSDPEPDTEPSPRSPSLVDQARAFGAAFRESFGFDPSASSTGQDSPPAEADDTTEADADPTDSTTTDDGNDGGPQPDEDDADDVVTDDEPDPPADGGDDAEPDSAPAETADDDAAEDDTNSTMTDDTDTNERIEELANDESVPFDEAVLSEFNDDQLAAIGNGPEDDGEPTDEGTGKEPDEGEVDDTDADSENDGDAQDQAQDDETESDEQDDFMNEIEQIKQELESVKQENQELREKTDPDVIQATQARQTLAQESDIDAEELNALPDETVTTMAANLGDTSPAQARANTFQQGSAPNMAGAPGAVSRTNTEDDAYPSGGREAYESRKNSGGDN